jgi:hypothetical protein
MMHHARPEHVLQVCHDWHFNHKFSASHYLQFFHYKVITHQNGWICLYYRLQYPTVMTVEPVIYPLPCFSKNMHTSLASQLFTSLEGDCSSNISPTNNSPNCKLQNAPPYIGGRSLSMELLKSLLNPKKFLETKNWSIAVWAACVKKNKFF